MRSKCRSDRSRCSPPKRGRPARLRSGVSSSFQNEGARWRVMSVAAVHCSRSIIPGYMRRLAGRARTAWFGLRRRSSGFNAGQRDREVLAVQSGRAGKCCCAGRHGKDLSRWPRRNTRPPKSKRMVPKSCRSGKRARDRKPQNARCSFMRPSIHWRGRKGLQVSPLAARAAPCPCYGGGSEVAAHLSASSMDSTAPIATSRSAIFRSALSDGMVPASAADTMSSCWARSRRARRAVSFSCMISSGEVATASQPIAMRCCVDMQLLKN